MPLVKLSADGTELLLREGSKYVNADQGRVTARGDKVAGARASADSEKPKPKRPRATRKPKAEEAQADAPVDTPAPSDQLPLFQGHNKAGIGHLKPDMPERRDGDGDTVVAERRPRKADEFKRSPLPVPEKYQAQARALARSRPKAKRKSGGSRKKNDGLRSSSGTPRMRIVQK